MAKKNLLDNLDDMLDEDLDMMTSNQLNPSQFNPNLVSKSSAEPVNDLFMIPVEQLVSFQRKGESDFSVWDEDELNDMANKMDIGGAYEPIIVRQIDNDKYEILAGEHRVKASKIKGLSKIKSVVYRACSDEKAMDIFLLTNLQRRKMKISDSIYGWSMFAKNHPNINNKDALENATYITDIFNTEKLPITMTQYYRYVKMSSLIKEFINALDNGKISIRVGYELSFFSDANQKMFLPFISKLSEEKVKAIRHYIDKENGVLTEQVIDEYLNTAVKPSESRSKGQYDSKLRTSMAKIRKRITEQIKPVYYDKADDIITQALSEFLINHPEYKV